MKLLTICLVSSLVFAVSAHAEDKASVKRVTQAYIKASGYDKLSADGTLVMKGTYVTSENGRARKPKAIRIYQQKASRIRIEITVGDRSTGLFIGNAGTGYAAEAYKSKTGKVSIHKMGVPDAILEMVAMIGDPNHIAKLAQYFDKVELVGTEKIRDKNCHIIKATGKKLGDAVFMINDEAGLMRFTCAFMGGKSKLIVDFTKWREVGKVRVPEIIEVSDPKNRISCKMTFTEWKTLKKFDAKDFFSTTKPVLAAPPTAK